MRFTCISFVLAAVVGFAVAAVVERDAAPHLSPPPLAPTPAPAPRHLSVEDRRHLSVEDRREDRPVTVTTFSAPQATEDYLPVSCLTLLFRSLSLYLAQNSQIRGKRKLISI